MPSILLDPHHQPSTSGFGARSGQRNSRSRYRAGHDIVEEAAEEESQNWGGRAGPPTLEAKDSYDSEPGLDESRWETSPTRGAAKGAQDEEEAEGEDGGGGVLGLLYQFQKAQTDGRPGINI
jgi:autophagy-related protein 9